MKPSFFELDFDPGGLEFTDAQFSAETRKHLKAQRIRPGDALVVVDGSGSLYDCEVLKSKKFRVLCKTSQETSRPPIHLILSPPRGDALWDLAAQITEMGVQSLRLFRSERCQWTPKMSPPFERLQRIADQACSQSFRAHRLQVHPSWETREELKSWAPGTHVVADEGLANTKPTLTVPAQTPYFLWIGPEGGWSESERLFFDTLFFKIGLGSLILRVPTAAVAAVQQIRILHALAHHHVL